MFYKLKLKIPSIFRSGVHFRPTVHFWETQITEVTVMGFSENN